MASAADFQYQQHQQHLPQAAPWPLEASLDHHNNSTPRLPGYGYSPATASLIEAWHQQPTRETILRSAFAAEHGPPSIMSFDSYHTDTESLAGNAPAAPAAPARTSSKASHAKLHKRSGSKSSVKGRKSEQSDRSALSFSRNDTPPMIVEGAFSDAKSTTPNSASRGKIKQNIRRLAHRDQHDDQTDVIDLSRSAAENEERSGLGITSPSTKSAIDVDFTRNVRHGRSFSHASRASTRSNSFKPSAPYVHPVYRSQPSFDGQSAQESHTDSFVSSFTGSYSGLFSVDSRTRTTSSASSIPHRPSLRIDTSSSSSGRMSALSRPMEGTPLVVRKRRDTAHSTDTPTPASRTSFDRAFSTRRGASEPMDEMVRQASIQAARQAFTERQEAKERKHRELERRAKEREQRKEEKKDERTRRKSESASAAAARRPSTAGTSPGAAATDDHDHDHDHEQPNNKDAAAPAGQKPRKAQGKPAGRSELPSVFAHDPPVSRKRHAKGVYVGALMWMKAKVSNTGGH